MKKHSICWLDFIIGAMTASVFWLAIYAMVIVPDVYSVKGTVPVQEASTPEADETVETTIKQYNTSLKKFSLSWDNGDSVVLNTPESFYSLTDQYLDEMCEYYGVEFGDMSRTYIVGNSDNSKQCSVMLNAAAMSDVSTMLTSIYGTATEEQVYSEAYRFMKDGKLPDELPDGYKLVDLGTVSVDTVDYRVFDLQYDVTYTYYAEEDTTQSNPLEQVVTYYELAAYSSTADPVEIIVYMTDYDISAAYSYLCDFIGHSFDGTLSEGTVVVDNTVVEEGNIENGD